MRMLGLYAMCANIAWHYIVLGEGEYVENLMSCRARLRGRFSRDLGSCKNKERARKNPEGVWKLERFGSVATV